LHNEELAMTDIVQATEGSVSHSAGLFGRWLNPRDAFTDLFARAGISLNGPAPWDMQVHRDRVFARTLARGSLGLGESYMEMVTGIAPHWTSSSIA
jgi:hypothetical protein